MSRQFPDRRAEHLDPSRVELSVVSLQKDGPLRARYDALGVPMTHWPVAGVARPSTISRGWAFSRFVREGGFDVVHCHDVYTNILFAPFARLAGTTSVIASRRWWTEVPRDALRVLNRWAYRSAHRVLANSESVGRLLVEREGVPASRLVIVPNFVDDDAFDEPDPRFVAQARAELGLGAEHQVVGIIANLRPIKQHAFLLDAIGRIASAWPMLRVVFVGEGSTRAELERQASALGIANRVIFAGTRPHSPSYHQTFDISTLVSRGEGFPNSVVEAMAAAKPVVATGVGGIVDAVVDGETGTLVSSGDVDHLARAIDALLRDPSRARAMGEAGRRRAMSLYRSESVLERLYQLYDAIARRR